MLFICQDYNRPITYLPYWYRGFDFTVYPDFWGKGGGSAASDQERFRQLQMQGFTLRPGFSPTGVFSDVQSLVMNAFPRKRLYDLSGFQPDGFINHHGGGCADTAMRAYGFEWIREIVDVALVLKDTRWGLERAGWPELPARIVSYTYPRIVFKNHIDWAFIGRSYMSDGLWEFGSKDLQPVVSHLLDLSYLLSDEVQQQLQTLKENLASGLESVVHGNTAFWNSDSMVMRARSVSGEAWHASLHMRSLFSHGNEDFEDEAKSWHTGSGMLLTRAIGDEYDMVRARMDWHLIPGVTEEWRFDTLPLKGHPMRCGGNTYASTVSDGTLGVAAFEYSHHSGPTDDAEAAEYSTAEANKAYFFQTWGIVAMGNSVRRASRLDGSLKRGQNQSIVTTVDQARWRGNISVTIMLQDKQVDRVFSPLDGSCDEDFQIPQDHFAYVHQGSPIYSVNCPVAFVGVKVFNSKSVASVQPLGIVLSSLSTPSSLSVMTCNDPRCMTSLTSWVPHRCCWLCCEGDQRYHDSVDSRWRRSTCNRSGGG